MLEQNPFASLNPLFPGDAPITVKDPVSEASAAPVAAEPPTPTDDFSTLDPSLPAGQAGTPPCPPDRRGPLDPSIPSPSTPLSSETHPSTLARRSPAPGSPFLPSAPQPVASVDSSHDHKLRVAVRALHMMEQNLQNVVRLIEEELGVASAVATDPFSTPDRGRGHAFGVLDPSTSTPMPAPARSVDGRVVEGVFDGFRMVGADGKVYAVPPNYASKSKLVEGDMLKLTITSSGSFIFKQIGPIERNRVVAELGYDPATGEYYAAEGTRRWSVLKASVTYFRGEADDEIILLVPMNAPSKWAAVENVIKKNPLA